MTDLNSVVLIGRLVRDMEISYTQGGMAIGNFAIANNRSRKTSDGIKDETSFFDITAFGKTAENLQNYLKKGKQVAITGSLKQDRWEKDGQSHTRISILADTIQLIGGGGKSEQKETFNAPPPEQNKVPDQVQNFAQSVGGSAIENVQEDIPF